MDIIINAIKRLFAWIEGLIDKMLDSGGLNDDGKAKDKAKSKYWRGWAIFWIIVLVFAFRMFYN